MQLLQSSKIKTLTSLALMESRLLSDDYLSTFLPFVATLAIKKNYSTVDIGTVVQDFKEEYGISIPRAPMQSILSKCVASNLILRSQTGGFIPIIAEMQKISFAAQQGLNNAKLDVLLDSFIDYVAKTHDIILAQNNAVDIFILFLDEYSPRTISGEFLGSDSEQFASNKDLFLMGEFIQSMAKYNISLFEYIRKLSMAYLITTALTFDEPVEKRVSEFSDLTIYLDTPVVLRLLGLQTEELAFAYAEMFETFKTTINPTFMIFQHTLDEISGIIGDCANWIDNPGYNPAYANPALLSFIKRNFTKTQVELFITTLESKLADLGITVDEKEYYHIVHSSAQIDSKILKEKLIEAYTQNNLNYNAVRNQHSIDYDVKSIDYIVKMWGTKSSRSYRRLGYLFITTNATLAFVCRKFSSEFWWDSKNHKTPCMTDYYLGTMVWLSTPASKIENVSKLKLIADCTAATALSKEVMEKFTYSLDVLRQTKGITNSAYLLLRKYAFEKNYLQNRTLNEETAFKDDTLDQILEDIKTDIQKPLLETLSNKENQIDELRNKNVTQNRIIEEFQRETEEAKQIQDLENEKVEDDANNTANRIINTFAPIAFAAFALVAALLQFVPLFSKWNPAIKIIASIVSFGSAVLFGILKSNLGRGKDKLVVAIKNYYLIERFKKHL